MSVIRAQTPFATCSPNVLANRVIDFPSNKIDSNCRRRLCSLNVSSSVAVFALTVSLAPAASCFGQTAHDADVKELERLEIVWNDAHERGDSTALEALWVEDLEVAVPKMPVMTKAEVLGFARSGRMKFMHYSTSDITRPCLRKCSRRNGAPSANPHFERQRNLRRLAIYKDLRARA